MFQKFLIFILEIFEITKPIIFKRSLNRSFSKNSKIKHSKSLRHRTNRNASRKAGCVAMFELFKTVQGSSDAKGSHAKENASRIGT